MRNFVIFILFYNFLFGEKFIDTYQSYIEMGTFENQDFSKGLKMPLSRFVTMKLAFHEFLKNQGKTILVLGASRSFTHSNHPGFKLADPSFWIPYEPKIWDWEDGLFSLICADFFQNISVNLIIADEDLDSLHITRIMTQDLNKSIQLRNKPSNFVLRKWNPKNKIDLLYLHFKDVDVIEERARMQLDEVRVIISRDLMAPRGLILIDGIKNQKCKKLDETLDLGISKYSIPYLLGHGFEIVMDEYQVLLRKI